MLFDKGSVKAVVAGGHGGMGGENDLPRNATHGFVEAQPLVLHPVADGFEHYECAMAFIEVKNARRHAHGPEGPKTPNSKNQLLANSNVRVAAVELRGQSAILRRVALHIRVQQKQNAP